MGPKSRPAQFSRANELPMFPQACTFFRNTGSCKYGRQCRFSHDASSTNPQITPRQSRPESTFDSQAAKFKRLVKQSSRPSTAFGDTTPADGLFALGLEVFNEVQDPGSKQEVIISLASNEGLLCIRAVANTRAPRVMAGTTADKIRFWELEVCPLFGMATHDTLVNSAALEEQVATIHNYLVGVEGSRLTALFDFVIDLAEAALHSSEVSVISVAELSLLVLSTLLNCGTLHIVNDSFEKYTSKLRDVAAASQPSLPQEGFSKSQALKYADFIDRRLAVGRSIPNANLTTRAAPVELASFLLRKDLPGNLSAEGPRHDNDHADIAKIAIMPTPDEINSARGEYLPTTESPTWHLPGIRGRLDREFRLLREDTVGQLRDVVRSEIDHMQNEATSKEANSTRRPKKDSIQYCVYEDAVIFKIDFSKFVGPEFVIRVRQPANGRASNEERGTMTKEAAARSLKQRYDWWTVKAKKRLQPGGLVCSIDSVGSVNFFTIGDSTMRTKSDIKEKNRWREDSSNIQKPKDTLADDPNHAYMTLTLLGANTQKQLSSALDWFFQSKTKKDSRLLVEFPGVLLDSFLHTLQALQSGSSLLNMPFIDIIAPRASDGQLQDGPFLDVPPPRYLQKPGIVLDMSCLTSTGELLEHCLEAPVTAEDIQRKTQLDGTQATALVEALSRSVALIQGPPGTGKTFLGVHLLKVLLENRQNAKLGPIIIVCYTNHALDQLLEHVLDSNPKANVLRMGSRSKSERLNQLNLREASMQVDRTRAEKRSMWSTRMQVDDHSDLLDVQFEDLNLSVSPGSIIKYLRVHDPAAYTGIFGDGAVDRNDGFSTVRSSPHDAFYKWRKGEELGPYMLGGSQRLWTLPKEERDALYLQWQNESFRQTSMAIEDEYKSYEVAKQASDAVRRSVDLRCMEAADIVGMTTTGLAKNCNLLKKLKSKVILCEEAGEVLEAHMLVSFLPSIEHAILIGDHRQLRPQVQNYELSSESLRGQQFAFDRSLFERLVSPPVEGELAVPFSQLTTQRRMHPSISALIRAPLYPALEDGPNVQAYPEVAGMAQRLFWFQHQHLEDGAARGGGKAKDADSMSRTNTFEVEMTVALVSHLFKQGTYASGDIAVLTPYLGQLMLLRQRFSSKFELTFNERDTADLEVADDLGSDGTQGDGPDSDSIDNAKSAPGGKPSTISKTKLLNSVRVATVDNFQGEEAKVVVVSLVRSNEQRRCGFLRTSNRINVLLSRAKHGMYILGNSDTCSGISMWQSVISALEAEGNMGPNLPLQCPRHPERTFEASLPDHFIQFAPDGGCMQSCDKRLACGHSCTGRCHADVIHAAVKCLEPCPRPLKGCSHACPLPCGESCVLVCRVLLNDTVLDLPCGHILQSPYCSQAQKPGEILCREKMKRTIPGCGHVLTVPCHEDYTAKNFKCRALCGAIQPCGHGCGNNCSNCNVRVEGTIVGQNHGICGKSCGRPYGTCGHECREKCHGDEPCPPCKAPCDTRCSHSRCPRPCNEPCVPCAEDTCASSCPHAVCTMPCAAPCNWIPCSKRCQMRLDCGHQCPSVCGEQCPDVKFCQVCGADDILDQTVDFIVMSTYRETDLNEDPCIFPACGHILAMSSMDGVMNMAQHYTMQETASGSVHPVALATSSCPFDMKEAKLCPNCRGSLRNIARYGRIVRRAVLDESTKRFIRWAHQQHSELASQLVKQKELFESPAASLKNGNGQKGPKKFFSGEGRSALIKELLLGVDASRFSSLVKTRNAIVSYGDKVVADEQPYKRVADLVQFALNRRDNDQPVSSQFVFDESVIQTKCSLHAELLLMRCDIMALEQVAKRIEKTLASTKRRVGEEQAPSSLTSGIEILKRLLRTKRFAGLLKEYEASIETARQGKHIKQEAESRLCCVQLCLALWKLYGWKDDDAAKGVGGVTGDAAIPEATQEPNANNGSTASKASPEAGPLSRTGLKEIAEQHLQEAQALFRDNLSLQTKIFTELVHLAAALRDIAVYRPVSADEMRAVYNAMASEFSGSGHWYTCANGHPFTVGECGMPMQQARCPECGAPVGGQQHMNAEGVQRADAIEELGRGVDHLAM